MDVNIDISLVDDLEELSLESTLKVQKVIVVFYVVKCFVRGMCLLFHVTLPNYEHEELCSHKYC